MLASDDRAVAEITFDKEDHLLIAHENVVGADSVQPALHRSLDSHFILFSTDTSGSKRRRNGRYKGVGVGRDEMVGKLDEFGMGASYIAELSGAELGQVCLGIMSAKLGSSFVVAAYIDVEAQDGILATGTL